MQTLVEPRGLAGCGSPAYPFPTMPSPSSPASSVRSATNVLADRLERAVTDGVSLLALTLDERAVMLAALEDPPQELGELRAVLLADHQWRRDAGFD